MSVRFRTRFSDAILSSKSESLIEAIDAAPAFWYLAGGGENSRSEELKSSRSSIVKKMVRGNRGVR